MRYKLILWDFDGTLADTLAMALQFYNEMAAEKGFKVITDPYSVRDMNISEFLKNHNIGVHRVPFLFARILKAIKAEAARVRFHSGIRELIEQINEMGLHQGIVSSNSTENIELFLTANQAMPLFGYVTGTSRIMGKATRIQKAMRKFPVPANEVLYIGDEIRDVEAAQAASVDVASVTWGLNSEQALKAQNPTWIVSEPSEILAILQ